MTDFGIAKAAEGLGLDLTRTGMVLGTPRYLSPEQIEGREPDPRADLYALGVVLFEMLTGRPPFPGPTDVATAVQHLNTPPPRVAQFKPGIPPALDALVAALLAKRPEDRPPTSGWVHQALAGLGTEHPGRGPEQPPLALPEQTTGSAHPLPFNRSQPDPEPAHWPPPPTLVTPPPSGGPTSLLWAGPGQDQPAQPAAPAAPPSARPAVAPTRPNWTGRVVGALVVAALIVIVVVLTGQGANREAPGAAATGSTAAAAVTHIQNVSVYHLERDADNATTVARAFDGNPATVWYTDRYFGPHFAGLRHGLGLAITLNGRHQLHSLTVTSPSRGWRAEVYVAAAVPSPPSLARWGSPVDTKQAVSQSTTFNLGGRAGSTILLWLTDLGPADQAGIAELSVR